MLNKSFVYDVMRGRSKNPNLEKLDWIAEVLNVDRNWLLHSVGDGEAPIMEDPMGVFVSIPSVEVTASMGGRRDLVTDEVEDEEPYHFQRSCLVDLSRKAPTPPRVSVLFDGMGLVAKRLEHIPNNGPAQGPGDLGQHLLQPLRTYGGRDQHHWADQMVRAGDLNMATTSNLGGIRTSQTLEPEKVYTRKDLKGIFSITDATINTGVFRPKGTSSVWLFITEEKTANQTQYRDPIKSDTLYWQGQTLGRSDPMIIEHRSRRLKLLVFFRKRQHEYPGAGFRYLGPFDYSSHSGRSPTSFVLKRQAPHAPLITPSESEEAPFDPSDIKDARERISRTIAQRRGGSVHFGMHLSPPIQGNVPSRDAR